MGLAGLERTEDIVLRTESRWIIARNHRCPFFQASDSERLASRLYGLKVFPAGDNAYFFARKRELYGEVATNGTPPNTQIFIARFRCELRGMRSAAPTSTVRRISTMSRYRTAT